jgi:hypothetical protein
MSSSKQAPMLLEEGLYGPCIHSKLHYPPVAASPLCFISSQIVYISFVPPSYILASTVVKSCHGVQIHRNCAGAWADQSKLCLKPYLGPIDSTFYSRTTGTSYSWSDRGSSRAGEACAWQWQLLRVGAIVHYSPCRLDVHSSVNDNNHYNLIIGDNNFFYLTLLWRGVVCAHKRIWPLDFAGHARPTLKRDPTDLL